MELSDLVYIDSSGYHYSDYPSFHDWLIAKYQNIYGADVYLGDDSQDGQFLAVLAQAFYKSALVGASVYNSFSPATAQGVGLSRNVKINGIKRQSATNSTVDLDIGGTVGTPITNGIAVDTLNQHWNLPDSVIIPSGGTITITATAATPGAISANANTVTGIFTPTLGWQTVNNASAATVGTAVETDAELRLRQAQSVANPSLTVLEGTYGAVANVTGVTAVRPYENDTGSTDGNGIPAHKICLVVAGGDAVAICQAIALHKTPGAGTYGATTEVVNDSHGMPLSISFQRPVNASIQATITLAAGAGWSSGFEAEIQDAVATVIKDFGIGNDILYTKLFAPAYLNGSAAGQTYDIASITLGKNSGMQSAANVTLTFDEIPTCDPTSDIVIVVT